MPEVQPRVLLAGSSSGDVLRFSARRIVSVARRLRKLLPRRHLPTLLTQMMPVLADAAPDVLACEVRRAFLGVMSSVTSCFKHRAVHYIYCSCWSWNTRCRRYGQEQPSLPGFLHCGCPNERASTRLQTLHTRSSNCGGGMATAAVAVAVAALSLLMAALVPQAAMVPGVTQWQACQQGSMRHRHGCLHRQSSCLVVRVRQMSGHQSSLSMRTMNSSSNPSHLMASRCAGGMWCQRLQLASCI